MIGFQNYSKDNKSVFVLLAGAFLLRFLLSPFGTLSLDQNTFIGWSNILVEKGFPGFYDGWSDYLPGYLYILWVLGKIKTLFPIPEMLLYKLPAIFSDVITGLIIYRILKDIKGLKWGLIGASLYLFNPAILANSTLWGQVDSLTALLSLLAIYLLPIRYPLSAISLSLGALIKPQAAFVAPVITFLMVKNKFSLSKVLSFGLLAVGVFIAGFIPFQNEPNLLNFILGRISISANQYPYTSLNAFNFWGLLGFWKPDNFLASGAGLTLAALIFVLVAVKLWRVKHSEYILTAVVFVSTFLLMTRMHERHLLPALAPLLIYAAVYPQLLVPYIGYSLIYLANLGYSFIWITRNFEAIFSPAVINFLIILNLLFLAYLLFVVFKKKTSMNRFIEVNGLTSGFPEIKLSRLKIKLLLGFILVFSLVSRVAWLESPPKEYFDEVYHAFTARQVLHGDPKAWEWWNTPPPGFAYEWTHPPLAKLGMVAGMLVFGENSFGWRIPGAILGVGSILLIFLIARKLFGDDLLALISSVIFSLDGVSLVMSRIGMNDSYLLFFVLLSIYLFLKEKNFLSAIAFGLALSSKWSAIWAIPIFAVILISRTPLKDVPYKVLKVFFWFLVLVPAVYLATYILMFLTGHGLDTFWGMQRQMWWYHTGLRATHPYTSPWWSWPLSLRPVYLYTSEEAGGVVSRIYAMGNPIVFWSGLATILFMVLAVVLRLISRGAKLFHLGGGISMTPRGTARQLGIILFSYLLFFVPWAASPRIMFLYHYLPSLPFLAIATAYVLRRLPKIIFAYLLICLLVFIYFYPHWAGLQIPLWLDKSYYWFSSWR